MSDKITFTIDDVEVEARRGQTIMEAADAAGIYITRLCAHAELSPHGSCRTCTVIANGQPQTACTFPVADGMVVENGTERVLNIRRSIVEMLFVEGNHFCMFCEKSGNCELQALAYRLGITAPRYPYMFPHRDVDATHPDIFADHNRCILCGRCVRASKELDGKNAFQFVGRGPQKQLGFNGRTGVGDTEAGVNDEALSVCPVGALMPKRVGYAVPVGRRLYDHEPIGSETEKARANRQ